MIKISIWIATAFVMVAVLEGFAAYYLDNNFFQRQVVRKWGRKGIFLFGHGGWWGNLVLLPLLLAWVTLAYGEAWTGEQIAIMIPVGAAVTLANHLNLIFNQRIPDPFGWQKEKWSAAIALHCLYMTAAVAIIGLFYFSSVDVSVEAAIAVSAVLGVYVAFGTHVPLGLANRRYQWTWCSTELNLDPKLQVGIWALLAGLATIVAGALAGFIVATIGLCLISFMIHYVLMSPIR